MKLSDYRPENEWTWSDDPVVCSACTGVWPAKACALDVDGGWLCPYCTPDQ